MGEPEKVPADLVLARAGEKVAEGAVVILGPAGMTMEQIVDAVLRSVAGAIPGDPEVYVMATPEAPDG